MFGYLKRLLTTGAAYQAADIVAKAIAVVTLPIYTRHLRPADYGAAETLLTAVIFVSILLRLGVGEAFVRFYYVDDDPARRRHLARTATATVAITTTVVGLACVAASNPLSHAVLGYTDPELFNLAVLGLWAFTNLEMAYAQLRVDERAGTYLRASMANVLMTVVFTILLVVPAHQGARGLLLGNFGASAIVVLALWVNLRGRIGLRPRLGVLGTMLAFGLPTVPADASVYALQVVDRTYLFRSISHASAGLYAVAVKLATVVFVFVRGFQYAWPPLAYSVESDDVAARLYSLVTTYYVLGTGVVVCGVALLGRWMVRLLAAHRYFDAYKALPWLALGWALYGLYLVFIVIAGRAQVTSRNFPAAAAGLVFNVALLLVLVPAGGAGLGIAGAGIALCGAYTVMLVVIYLLTRNLFRVGFEWGRLALLVSILAAVAVSGELLLPTHGAGAFLARAAWLLWVPAALVATRFFRAHEIARGRQLLVEGRRRTIALWGGTPGP